MSWRVMYEEAGERKLSQPLRTRTETMLYACDLYRETTFVSAVHSTGQTISKLELETWRRANDTMLKGRVSPRSLVTDREPIEGRFKTALSSKRT